MIPTTTGFQDREKEYMDLLIKKDLIMSNFLAEEMQWREDLKEFMSYRDVWLGDELAS